MRNDKILGLFGRAIPHAQKIDFEKLSAVAAKHGYVVDPQLSQEDVFAWISGQQYNPNATFYTNFREVTSRSRLALWVDQVRHYFSTYGTAHQGKPYIPNEAPPMPAYTQFKTISPITAEEVIGRCEQLLFSGIALKQTTAEDAIDVLLSLGHTIHMEKVKNREAKLMLMDKLGQLPDTAGEMMRFLVYKATGSSLLIKSKEVIRAIGDAKPDINAYVNAFGAEKLATVFLRYKPLLLAFRANERNRPLINKLRRLAVKHHRPVGKPFVETVLADPQAALALREKLDRIPNFRKISLLQTIRIRQKQIGIRPFVIRNQKIFIKTGQTETGVNRYDELYTAIYESLIGSLRKKACSIALPEGVYLTLPTSEKSFIGHYPLGTSFDLADHDAMIGIYWRGEDGAQDLDLSLIDIDGNKIGWDAAYYNQQQTLVYSGDMTSAEPEASEVIYAANGFGAGIVKVNLYCGSSKSKLKLFAARESIQNREFEAGYMVNPDNILFSIDTEMDSREKSFAVVGKGRLTLAQFRTGAGSVSGDSVTNQYTDYALAASDCYLSLPEVLSDAGFVLTKEAPDLDLRLPSADKLIALFQG